MTLYDKQNFKNVKYDPANKNTFLKRLCKFAKRFDKTSIKSIFVDSRKCSSKHFVNIS